MRRFLHFGENILEEQLEDNVRIYDHVTEFSLDDISRKI